MFPARPRPMPGPRQQRRMPPTPFGMPRMQQPQQQKRNRSVFAMFQTQEGSLDFDKISSTARQFNQIYHQVSPMVGPLLSKFFK
ncbi:YppG family protein [Lentibacillus sp. L22]|uniref:YppG family protein n=1 Tax=Lentibacillus sp. L22 TaxID=3163028 RepID=UPI0034664714